MGVFKDLGGNTRELRIDFRHLGRLRENNGVVIKDLAGDATGGKMGALLNDPERFAEVLFTLSARPGETADAFYQLLDMPTLEAAAAPFMEAVLSFSQGSRAGAVLAAELDPKIADLAARRTEAVEALAAQFGQSTSRTSGESSPASSALTRDR